MLTAKPARVLFKLPSLGVLYELLNAAESVVHRPPTAEPKIAHSGAVSSP